MAFDEKFVNYIISNYPDKKNMVALDIGANMGKYTGIMARKFRKVYAIEVCKETCEILRETFKDHKNIEVCNLGICDIDDDQVKMYYQGNDPTGRGGNTLSYFVAEQKKWGHDPNRFNIVKGITIDSFVKANRIKALRLIKMDVEGGENFAWVGAAETLKNHQLDIILEVHNCVNYPKLWNLFVNAGYLISETSGKPAKEFKPDTHYFITNRHK